MTGKRICTENLDGNQTLVRNSTSVWQVTYSGENRPAEDNGPNTPFEFGGKILLTWSRTGT